MQVLKEYSIDKVVTLVQIGKNKRASSSMNKKGFETLEMQNAEGITEEQ